MKTILAFSFLFMSNLLCQDVYRIGIGLNSITPVGDFAEFSNSAVGFSFYSEYEIDENIIADVIVIISNFDAKIKNVNHNLSFVKRNIKNSSLMLGIQYKLLKNLFLTINGGMNYTTLPEEYYQYFNNSIQSKTKTESYSILSPGFNYRIYFSPIISSTFFAQYSIVNGHLSNFNNISFGSAIFLDLDL